LWGGKQKTRAGEGESSRPLWKGILGKKRRTLTSRSTREREGKEKNEGVTTGSYNPWGGVTKKRVLHGERESLHNKRIFFVVLKGGN